ncbi:MAG: hypothetical protein ACMUIG_07435 [Thermoplasmatota archaeon]
MTTAAFKVESNRSNSSSVEINDEYSPDIENWVLHLKQVKSATYNRNPPQSICDPVQITGKRARHENCNVIYICNYLNFGPINGKMLVVKGGT